MDNFIYCVEEIPWLDWIKSQSIAKPVLSDDTDILQWLKENDIKFAYHFKGNYNLVIKFKSLEDRNLFLLVHADSFRIEQHV